MIPLLAPAIVVGAYGLYRMGRRRPESLGFLAFRLLACAVALGAWCRHALPVAAAAGHPAIGFALLAPATAALVGLVGLDLLHLQRRWVRHDVQA